MDLIKRIITGGSGFILKTTGTSSISDSQGTKCRKRQTCCEKKPLVKLDRVISDIEN